MGIVKAQESDAPAIANLLVRSWRAAYKGIMPDEFLDTISIPQWVSGTKNHLKNGSDTWLLKQSAETIGVIELCAFRDLIDEFSHCGEIRLIYLTPEKYGMNLGGQLLEFALTQFTERGIHTVCVWTLEKNKRAIGFYQKHGFVFSGQTKISKFAELTEQLFIKTVDPR